MANYPSSVTIGATGHVADHNSLIADIGALRASADCYATVQFVGSNIVARKNSDGTTISSGTNASTVINAALTAASGAGGGAVRIAHGTYHISATISLPAGCGLVGHSSFIRASTPIGSILLSDGLTSSDPVVKSNGNGCFVQGIAINANHQAGYAFAHLLGADCRVYNCHLLFAQTANFWHNPTGTSFAFKLVENLIWGSANYGVYVQSGTDGHIRGNTILESAQICCYVGAGGWIVSGNHITHSSSLTTTQNTVIAGAICIVTGNYIDSCKNGYALTLAAAGITCHSNFIYNSTSNNGWNKAILLDNAQGSNIAGNTTQTASGIGMSWNSGHGLPVSGVYGPNYHNSAAQQYIDLNTGSAVAAANTSQLFVAACG